ncbi:MAG: molybdopterin-synthase adenylyltransferase MoeB [Actinomycetota bacterium]|jgi:adenylyltransferase/sulfurtransferase|nr:molybdopterin-synthase adenylyltransferase MoeB [Euzebyaceae bacterium]MDQ3452637.1 molybdopterin-synthase adenylyltransferase MoeB [Actinomycetota bacterium]
MEPLIKDPAALTNDEIRRYSRHLIMPNVGVEGQGRLKASKVLLVGTGGLGSPLAMYLAAAGVGTLGLVDFDVVDESNLHRQVIHGTSDIGKRKVVSAAETIADINPHVNVEIHETALTSDNAMEIIRPYDLVIDGTDNFPTRYLVNDACVLLGKPNVYGSIFRFDGQLAVFYAEEGPCYRCMFPEPPPPGMVPSCAEGGVFGVICATIGAGQATEGIKLLTGIGEPLIGRMQIYDALEARWQTIKVNKDPECPVCGKNPTVTELIDYEQFCGVPANDHEASESALSELEIDPLELAEARDRVRLIDVRDPHEYEISRIPGAELMPLGDLHRHLSELDSSEDIVLHCKSGMRSMQALEQLQGAGFRKVRSLRGGINAYAREVDDSIPTY